MLVFSIKISTRGVENPDAAEAGKCGWCLRKQEGAVGWPEPGNNPL